MNSRLTLIGLTVAATALAGCVETSGSTGGQMAPAASGPPFIETMDGSVSNAAVSACQNALSAETTGGVRVVGSEFSQAASAVYMRVGANGAPSVRRRALAVEINRPCLL